MIGCRYLLISDNKVIKIPRPKDSKFRFVPQLANKKVLEVILFYENKDRKPYQLLMVEFDRFRFDSNGIYEETDTDRRRALHNFFEFGIPSSLIKDEDRPISIPVPPIIPTDVEKELLYSYLTVKMPSLAKDAPYIVENRIRSLKDKYAEFIRIAKARVRKK